MSKEKDTVTKAEREGSQHLIPKKIQVVNGRPTKEVRQHNEHIEQYLADQQAAPKRAKMAMDVMGWQFDEIHKSLNPKNKGTVEEVLIENPNFDYDKPIDEKTNPFLITKYQHMYDPTRFKENTVKEACKEFIGPYKKYIDQVQDEMKRQRVEEAKLEREAKLAEERDGGKNKSYTQEVSTEPLISIEFDDPTVN